MILATVVDKSMDDNGTAHPYSKSEREVPPTSRFEPVASILQRCEEKSYTVSAAQLAQTA